MNISAHQILLTQMNLQKNAQLQNEESANNLQQGESSLWYQLRASVVVEYWGGGGTSIGGGTTPQSTGEGRQAAAMQRFSFPL